MRTISDFGGATRLILQHPDPEDRNWTAFNPCIAYSPVHGYSMSIRSSNFHLHPTSGQEILHTSGSVRNRTWLARLEIDSLSLTDLREVSFDNRQLIPERRGAEDGRLSWTGGDNWTLTSVIWERPEVPLASIAEYALDSVSGVATLVRLYDDRSTHQKNWMPVTMLEAKTPEFTYLVDPHTVYSEGYRDTLSRENHKDLSNIHGGTQLLEQDDGTYMAVVHRVHFKPAGMAVSPTTFSSKMRYTREYSHYFARYSAEGYMLEISEGFCFEGPGIEFAAGMAQHGEDFLISWGKNDTTAHLAQIPAGTALTMLQPL